MELVGTTGTLTEREIEALTKLPYERGRIFKVFKTAKSGATVLVLDILTETSSRNRPHVVKIQDVRMGNVEKQGHDLASRFVPNDVLPALVEYVNDDRSGLSVTVYEIAGASVFGIRPLSYYIEHQVAAAEAIVGKSADFLTELSPLSDHLLEREQSSAFDFCRSIVNAGKNRLDGQEGLAVRFEAILPGISSRSSLAFNDVPDTFPNPIAYIYDASLWRDALVISPSGRIHGDYHSDNLLWSESDRRLNIIDWATFSESACAFTDFALLEIDIVQRSLGCSDKRDWSEWKNIGNFLGSAHIPDGAAPSGYLAVQLWRVIKPLRSAVGAELTKTNRELAEIFTVAYLLALYSTTVLMIRNGHISADRKIGLLLLGANYLRQALGALNLEWQSRQTLVVPAAYEIAVKTQPGRDVELKYLDDFISEWQESTRYYTPLSGEASLGQPRMRMDLFYELLEERQEEFAPSADSKLYQITDILQEVLAHRRVALLGDPGAGKSSTLMQLAVSLAVEAKVNPNAPIPIVVPLGGYSADQSLMDLLEEPAASGPLKVLRGQLGSLAADNRLAFLLDGVNEMGDINKEAGTTEIVKLANNFPSSVFVITCRTLEYPRKIPLDRITIRPLDPLRIKAFLTNYLGVETGEELFWRLVDRDGQGKIHYWPRFQAGGGKEADFWLAIKQPEDVKNPWFAWDWEFWIKIRDNPRSYLALARNPYLLSMISGTFATNKSLPTNRGALFKLFVDSLMARENARCDASQWIDEGLQYAALSRLAYAMQRDRLGTSVDRQYTAGQLKLPGMLDLALKESILERIGGKIAFTHELLREFFAAYALDKERLENNIPATDFWPPSEWWRPVGLEETSVILAGIYRENPLSVLEWLREANPELAARCVVDGGIKIGLEFRQLLIAAWLPRLTDTREPVLARAAVGRALGVIRGDIRPGVMYLDDQTGIPRFEWISIPSGNFRMGTGATAREVPVDAFRVSKYLVTNEQYSAFVDDGGYTQDWRKCWSETGWSRKANATGPTDYSETLVLPNHPRIGINWYEALAFCRWLDIRLHELGEINGDQQARLPTEAEWEKLARGPEGKDYPWGQDFRSDLCNVTDIESTTAVGIFPDGASPYGVCDVVGNAWKWCLTKWNPHWEAEEDNSFEGSEPRCYRGGSWGSNLWRDQPWSPSEVECHRRNWIVPEDDRPDAIGFFIVIGRPLY